MNLASEVPPPVVQAGVMPTQLSIAELNELTKAELSVLNESLPSCHSILKCSSSPKRDSISCFKDSIVQVSLKRTLKRTEISERYDVKCWVASVYRGEL